MGLRVLAAAAAVLAAWGLSAPNSRAAEDYEGLPPGPGREEVLYTCQACHSLMLVKQQGLNREDWDETLTWMVEEQGMAELSAKEHDLIVDYLATHYGRDRAATR